MQPLLLGHIVELARGEERPCAESAGWAEKTIGVVFAARDSSDFLARVMAVEDSSRVRFLPV